jgi:hypothetical protein
VSRGSPLRLRLGGDTSIHVDDVRILKLLASAADALAARKTAGASLLAEPCRLVSEAGESLAPFRRLAELQELLVEVTALVEAGVDEGEVETKLARALRMADEIAAEVGTGEGQGGPPAGGAVEEPVRATLTSISGSGQPS